MLFNCEPDRADILKPLLYEELEGIIKHEPKEEDLDKVLTNMCKDKEQAKPHNLQWLSVIYDYYKTGINYDDPKNFEEILDKTTVKSIQEWAREFTHKADIVDVIFYPENEQSSLLLFF